jgi:dienelactone hydrolase
VHSVHRSISFKLLQAGLRMRFVRSICLFLLCFKIGCGRETIPSAIELGSKFSATDTLACNVEAADDVQECLAALSWKPTAFTVHLEAAQPGCGDWLVRFPSPRPTGNQTNDLVSMEWFAARNPGKTVRLASAIVVVHESGRRMTVGRLIARGLSAQGLHAFLLHLPGYGPRRAAGAPDVERMLPAMRQAIADARRARDAVVVLPTIDDSVVGVQGTSLGGFVTATVAGLDAGYDRVFILLAGGNLQQVVLHGAKDAAKIRKRLAAAGLTDEQIKELAHQVEPLRLAKRINPAETWLYSGTFDDVVPPSCSLALAKAARLPADHHIHLPVDHYSGILYLPMVIQQIQKNMAEPLEVFPPNHSMNSR